MRLSLSGDLPRRVRRVEALLADNDALVLALANRQQFLPRYPDAVDKIPSELNELRRLASQPASVRTRQTLDDPLHRLLQLSSAFQVVVEHTHAKRLESFRYVVTQDTKGLRRVRRHEHRLAVRQKMTDQVCDRV